MTGWLKALGSTESASEHRQRQRLERYFDCTWVSPWGEERARVSSVSENGCYVESRFNVPEEGTVIPEISIMLSSVPLILQGTVINRSPGIGFAIRFTEIDDDMRALLRTYVSD